MITSDTVQVSPTPTQQLQGIVEAAFAEAPLLYANGFVNGLGLTDAYIVLQVNSRSMAVINMSPAMAKTLGQSLLAMIEAFERERGQTVPTLEELLTTVQKV